MKPGVHVERRERSGAETPRPGARTLGDAGGRGRMAHGRERHRDALCQLVRRSCDAASHER
eukprot:2826178-Pyramimonas_sp.AAC.1